MAKSEAPADQAEWLGAGDLEPKELHICVFIPSLTRDGRQLDHVYWRNETVRIMSRLFGGATVVEGFGGWLDDERGGHIKEEGISAAFSFFRADDWHEENVLELRKFLHRMGREAEQGEIGVYLNGKYRPIQRFDNE